MVIYLQKFLCGIYRVQEGKMVVSENTCTLQLSVKSRYGRGEGAKTPKAYNTNASGAIIKKYIVTNIVLLISLLLFNTSVTLNGDYFFAVFCFSFQLRLVYLAVS